jgi:GNAT superfamily N-acetyltransferase
LLAVSHEIVAWRRSNVLKTHKLALCMNSPDKLSPALLEAATTSEAMLFGAPRRAPPLGGGNWLMIRPVADAPEASSLTLKQISGPEAWALYTDLREKVELAINKMRADAEGKVREMHEQQRGLPIKWYFAMNGETPVGMVGMMTLASGGAWYGRMVDLDVVPEFRKQGFANQILLAIDAHAKKLGLKAVAMATDEDDWTSAWLERHGFLRATRVGKQ